MRGVAGNGCCYQNAVNDNLYRPSPRFRYIQVYRYIGIVWKLSFGWIIVTYCQLITAAPRCSTVCTAANDNCGDYFYFLFQTFLFRSTVLGLCSIVIDMLSRSYGNRGLPLGIRLLIVNSHSLIIEGNKTLIREIGIDRSPETNPKTINPRARLEENVSLLQTI